MTIEPTIEEFGSVGSNTMQRYVGSVQCKVQLTPRICVAVKALVSPDDYALLLLGNDIFNKEVVRIIAYSDAEQLYTVSYNGQVDVMQRTLLTPSQRQKMK